MPKIVDIPQMKKKIVENAYRVFVDQGYYRTKLSDISQRSQMKRTTFYSYYKNKEAVFEATILFLVERVNQMAESHTSKDRPFTLADARAFYRHVEKELGFQKVFRIFMELWLMLTRKEFALSKETLEKIQEGIKQFSPHASALKRILVSGELSEKERLNLSFLLAFPKKFALMDELDMEALFPYLTLYD